MVLKYISRLFDLSCANFCHGLSLFVKALKAPRRLHTIVVCLEKLHRWCRCLFYALFFYNNFFVCVTHGKYCVTFRVKLSIKLLLYRVKDCIKNWNVKGFKWILEVHFYCSLKLTITDYYYIYICSGHTEYLCWIIHNILKLNKISLTSTVWLKRLNLRVLSVTLTWRHMVLKVRSDICCISPRCICNKCPQLSLLFVIH